MSPKELADKLEQVRDNGSIRQQTATIKTVVSAIEAFVSEVAEEEKLAQSVHQIRREMITNPESIEDKNHNDEITRALSAAMNAKKTIDDKKRALRGVANDVRAINTAIQRLV